MSEHEDKGGAQGPAIVRADSKGTPYSIRLKRAREAVLKSPERVASEVGVPVATYYDWEWGEGDISSTASLAELAKLSASLAVSTTTIFEDASCEGQRLSLEELSRKIRSYLEKANMTIAEFEDRVGYEVEPALHNSEDLLKWNVDCLRCVCTAVGVNWLCALP
jgi:hypothetical protein